MSHFAKVIYETVVDVIVAEQDVIDSGIFGSPELWIQTSYNTRGGQHPEGRPLRKNFACIGYTYDTWLDAFIPPKPYDSWILNEETCLWEPPVPYPVTNDDDNRIYYWDEETQSWLEMEIPSE